ncbi:TetR/AcrR family transcriptional regulator [Leucobacter sp. W1478]|uniref:TetR/AcrR family transcriptional regulator n=1 Tax=Leucobacter sp. W1478 TaxID=3439065 RepID=UPI003F3AC156
MPLETSPHVRPPRQERSQVAWGRILDAGVSVLEEAGYEGFTIAAICTRARVAPPAIYARVQSKQALFLAVFEHGFDPIREQQQLALAPDRWTQGDPEEVVRCAIEAIAQTSLAHERFLRPVVRHAETDDEVAARTREARAGTARRFRELVSQHPDALRSADPERIDACFRVVFAALLARIAHANALDIGSRVSDSEFISDLQDTAVRALLRDGR